jgi:hypothetical protein
MYESLFPPGLSREPAADKWRGGQYYLLSRSYDSNDQRQSTPKFVHFWAYFQGSRYTYQQEQSLC